MLTLQRPNIRRLAIFVPFAFIITCFRHRIFVALCLAYTYFAFTFLHTSVIGVGDGFDLLNMTPPPDSQEVVPRILHQARLGNLPMQQKWIDARQTCLDLHTNWTINLWEDDTADAFVLKEYPYLFDMYRGYGQEIQRSNAIRYLILYKQGGIYLDLDVKCKKPLDPFLTQSWLSPPGLPAGINNAFMTSSPGNPFMRFAIDHLLDYDLNWFSLYATDMFSTGCHYISTMHALFPDRHLLKVMPKGYKLGGKSDNEIFQHLGAAVWHRGDAYMIKKLGNLVGYILEPWKIFAMIGVAVGIWYALRRRRAAKAVERERNRDEENVVAARQYDVEEVMFEAKET